MVDLSPVKCLDYGGLAGQLELTNHKHLKQIGIKYVCVFSRFWADRPSVQKPGLWFHCVCTFWDDAHHWTRGRCSSLPNAFCLLVHCLIVCCEPTCVCVCDTRLYDKTLCRTVNRCDPASPWRIWQPACTRTEPSWLPCCRDTGRAEGRTSTVTCCPHRWVWDIRLRMIGWRNKY